jgi:hypothetical protein
MEMPVLNLRAVVGAAVLIATCAATPFAAAADDAAAKARYEADRAKCLSGTSQESQATCLKESGAVLKEREQGKIQATPKDQATLKQNAMQRCTNLPAKDKADSESRVNGQGVTEGSVGGGGIVKETVTTTVQPRGSQVPPDTKQVGTLPAAVLPAPPAMSSAPH